MITSIENLKQILNCLNNTSIHYLELQENRESVYIQRQLMHQTSDTLIKNHSEEKKSKLISITSTQIGFFQASQDNNQRKLAFNLGDLVQVGDILGYIRCLNIFHQVKSQQHGILKKILIDHSQPVEYGQPLFQIDTTIKKQ